MYYGTNLSLDVKIMTRSSVSNMLHVCVKQGTQTKGRRRSATSTRLTGQGGFIFFYETS